MRWILTRFLGAVVAGIGWKLGADAYESIKQELQKRSGGGDVESGAAAEETEEHPADGSDEVVANPGKGASR